MARPVNPWGLAGVFGQVASLQQGQEQIDMGKKSQESISESRSLGDLMSLIQSTNDPNTRATLLRNFMEKHPESILKGIEDFKQSNAEIPEGLDVESVSQGPEGKRTVKYGKPSTQQRISDLMATKEPGSEEWMKLAKLIKPETSTTVNVGGEPAPSGERQALTKIYDFQDKLNRIKDLYQPSYAGPIEGAIKGTVEKYTGIGVTEKGIEFRTLVNELGDDLLRLKSGAQINEQEFQRLMKFLPNPKLPNKTFQTRLNTFLKTYKDVIKTKEDALTASGMAVPRITGTPQPSPQGATINIINKATGEKLQSLDGGKTWQPRK